MSPDFVIPEFWALGYFVDYAIQVAGLLFCAVVLWVAVGGILQAMKPQTSEIQ